MPFKSEAQRKFMFAAEGRGEIAKGTAERWARDTPKGKKLPEHVKKQAQEDRASTFEAALSCGFDKEAARLTGEARKKLSLGEFAEPGKKKYPIEDKAHARDALSRVSANGSSGEKSTVRAAVKSKYPDIHQKKAFEVGMAFAMAEKRASTAELVGLGALAVPAAIDAVHKPKNETVSESRMRKVRVGAELGGLGILAADTIRKMKTAADVSIDIHGDLGETTSFESRLMETPLGERVLADYNGRNEHLLAAVNSWRRMRDAGTDRARPRP